MTQLIPPYCTSPQSSRSPVQLRRTSVVRSSTQQEAVCLGKIAAGTYNRMATHPDGSSRMFLSTKEGEIWLALDDHVRGSGSTLQMNDSPFLDLTDRVLQLVGMAFHPEFATNGRFFVSYTCDNSTMPSCAGSCSSATGNGSMLTSQYHLVVSEFSAKGGHDYSKVITCLLHLLHAVRLMNSRFNRGSFNFLVFCSKEFINYHHD